MRVNLLNDAVTLTSAVAKKNDKSHQLNNQHMNKPDSKFTGCYNTGSYNTDFNNTSAYNTGSNITSCRIPSSQSKNFPITNVKITSSKVASIFVAMFAVLLFAMPARAQLGDLGEVIRTGTADANMLLEQYIRPYSNGLGANFNTGWSNTGGPRRVLGVDVRVSAAVALVPSADETFDLSELMFSNPDLQIMPGSPSITPTAAGPDDLLTRAVIGQTFTNPATGLEETLYEFQMPNGTGFPYVPSPMVQVNLGLPMDFEIAARVLPAVSLPDDGELQLFGAGIKHGINSYIPGGFLLPVDLAVQVGYTSLTLNVPLDVQPQGGIYSEYEASQWENQNVELNATALSANFLVGRNLPFLSVFAGAGYQVSNNAIKATGSYPVTVANVNYNPVTSPFPRVVQAIDDPVDLDMEGENDIHFFGGFRFKLGFLALNATYTHAKYPVANVGIGLSI